MGAGPTGNEFASCMNFSGCLNWISCEDPLFDRITLHKLPFDEFGNSICGHSAVPIPLGVDHQDWATFTNSQAPHLGPVASSRASRKRKRSFFELVLQRGPSEFAILHGTARFPDAQKNMSDVATNLELLSNLLQLFLFNLHVSCCSPSRLACDWFVFEPYSALLLIDFRISRFGVSHGYVPKNQG